MENYINLVNRYICIAKFTYFSNIFITIDPLYHLKTLLPSQICYLLPFYMSFHNLIFQK